MLFYMLIHLCQFNFQAQQGTRRESKKTFSFPTFVTSNLRFIKSQTV